ncbi:S1C family serine protease [Salinispira pacifica]|uniref:PDZ domain-containing protein n=1 Tax=Salinispira pacifica TaxID=1307761 RepID=V5WGV4_9SPIO|nr:trypsin-like peptidase domain-containing protein [Salinispira pacifica]AHC14406.1 hypothetical protein L21SP2_0988 [Salinispira pacifica]
MDSTSGEQPQLRQQTQPQRVPNRILKRSLPFGAVLAALLLAVSCQTTEVQESYNADAFIQEVRYFFQGPDPFQALKLLNEHYESFPEAAGTLLNELYGLEQAEFSRALEENRLYNAVTHYHNLDSLMSMNLPTIAGDARNLEEQRDLLARQALDTAAFDILFILDHRLTENFFQGEALDLETASQLLTEVKVEFRYRVQDIVERRAEFSGSGIIVGPRHILTAYHVVQGFDNPRNTEVRIEARTSGGRTFTAEVKGVDTLNDLAVLQLEETLPFSMHMRSILGDSSELKQGETMYSYGHPYGYTDSLSRGIISTVSRPAAEVGNVIQFDANSAPGNSGGMMLGDDFRIYGLVSSGLSGEEINFAIPTRTILGKIQQLMNGEHTGNAWLGITSSEVEEGLRIDYLFPSSPLKEFGLVSEDIIMAVNNISADEITDMQSYIASRSIGSIVELQIRHADGSSSRMLTRLHRRPDFPLNTANFIQYKVDTLLANFGFSVHSEDARTVDFDAGNETISMKLYQVKDVLSGTQAYNLGIRPDDQIGLIADEYNGGSRRLHILHLPQGENSLEIDISDFILTLWRSKYAKNIL